MIKKVFFSHSFSNRSNYQELYFKLKEYLREKNIILYSFVFEFTDKADNKTLMSACLSEIKSSDFFLAELSDESVGVGFELGYAKALGMKTAYLYKEGTPLELTADGTVDHLINYESTDDVIAWFKDLLENKKS